jgi:hypothetical protein
MVEDRDPHVDLRKMVAGDIVVTRVARHYALGRLNADLRTQTPIEAYDHRTEALRRACALAGEDRRVFLYELAGHGDYVQINCSEAFERDRLSKVVHGERHRKSRTRR